MDPRMARITTVFDALDTNSNGYLERDDFVRLGRGVIDSLGEDESSRKAREFAATCIGYWEGLVGFLDRDGDGRIDCGSTPGSTNRPRSRTASARTRTRSRRSATGTTTGSSSTQTSSTP